ncbi:TetR/AcrR family transcriptional regulator [Streptomyces sp. I05A-00742]|uniref:TetR/AcrR family transcriptional regulator n=1 Tax=Streptomyces sp. I05A-00742 TaxID=2732853 RepID=UPI0014897567|nr:TetR/AcrR family transcriptional regulator [Streptomyces sp. I05A-00742]
MSERNASEQLPLRQRKKLLTRQRISDVATRLFFERGFDEVTVAEVAEAAEVSAMTVFNHFPRKEDLFLDRIPEGIALATAAVRDRDPAESPVAALRCLALRLVDEGHPLAAVGYAPFWRIVYGSPALRARVREGAEELEAALTAAIAACPGGSAPDPQPRMTAALAVAAYRAACAASLRRAFAGEPAEEVVLAHRALVERVFGELERVLPLGG